MSNFKIDLKTGRKYEQLFENYLKKNFKLKTELSPDKYFPDWDVSTTGGTRIIKFEVKYVGTPDHVYVEDGHLVDHTFVHSGLNLTQSDYYVFCFDDQFHLIKTDDLKEFCYGPEHRTNRDIMYDRTDYRLFIFSKKFIIENSIILNNETK